VSSAPRLPGLLHKPSAAAAQAGALPPAYKHDQGEIPVVVSPLSMPVRLPVDLAVHLGLIDAATLDSLGARSSASGGVKRGAKAPAAAAPASASDAASTDAPAAAAPAATTGAAGADASPSDAESASPSTADTSAAAAAATTDASGGEAITVDFASLLTLQGPLAGAVAEAAALAVARNDAADASTEQQQAGAATQDASAGGGSGAAPAAGAAAGASASAPSEPAPSVPFSPGGLPADLVERLRLLPRSELARFLKAYYAGGAKAAADGAEQGEAEELAALAVAASATAAAAAGGAATVPKAAAPHKDKGKDERAIAVAVAAKVAAGSHALPHQPYAFKGRAGPLDRADQRGPPRDRAAFPEPGSADAFQDGFGPRRPRTAPAWNGQQVPQMGHMAKGPAPGSFEAGPRGNGPSRNRGGPNNGGGRYNGPANGGSAPNGRRGNGPRNGGPNGGAASGFGSPYGPGQGGADAAFGNGGEGQGGMGGGRGQRNYRDRDAGEGYGSGYGDPYSGMPGGRGPNTGGYDDAGFYHGKPRFDRPNHNRSQPRDENDASYRGHRSGGTPLGDGVPFGGRADTAYPGASADAQREMPLWRAPDFAVGAAGTVSGSSASVAPFGADLTRSLGVHGGDMAAAGMGSMASMGQSMFPGRKWQEEGQGLPLPGADLAAGAAYYLPPSLGMRDRLGIGAGMGGMGLESQLFPAVGSLLAPQHAGFERTQALLDLSLAASAHPGAAMGPAQSL
jgi:hypothetical protein